MANKEQKNKLMFFVYIFGQGGAERVILNILNYIDNKKYEIHLIIGEKGKRNKYLPLITNKNIQIDYLDIPFGQQNEAIQALSKKINQYNPDILLTEAKYTNNIAYHAKKLSKNHHVKLIFREAVNRSACKDERFIDKFKTSFHYNFGPKKIICVSDGVAKDLIKNYKIARRKIAIINNPIDLDYIQKKSLDPIENRKFKEIKGKKIINIGRLAPSKNQKLLINAFSKIKNQNSSLIILGSGELEKELKHYCRKKKIDNVYFFGNVANPYQYIKNCDLFVLSSIREGFSNATIESMALGTPVISTDCPSGAREIIGDNKYGILVPLNDSKSLATAIDNLLCNASLSKQYSSLGIKRSKNFAAQKIVKKYEEIIDNIKEAS